MHRGVRHEGMHASMHHHKSILNYAQNFEGWELYHEPFDNNFFPVINSECFGATSRIKQLSQTNSEATQFKMLCPLEAQK